MHRLLMLARILGDIGFQGVRSIMPAQRFSVRREMKKTLEGGVDCTSLWPFFDSGQPR